MDYFISVMFALFEVGIQKSVDGKTIKLHPTPRSATIIFRWHPEI